MKWFMAVWHLLSLLILSFPMAEANLPDQWRKRNKDLKAVIYGNNSFVVVGNGGLILQCRIPVYSPMIIKS